MAHQWSAPKTATVKMPVGVTEAGYIATSEDTPAGKKAFAIAGIKTDATLEQSAAVFDAFVGDIAGGTFDSVNGATKTVTYNVVEVEEP